MLEANQNSKSITAQLVNDLAAAVLINQLAAAAILSEQLQQVQVK